MSNISIAGDTSGSIILQAPAIAGGNTATLPAATGTVMVSGNMPAFSAYKSAAQSIPHNTFTKVQFETESYDTANCYDNTTNYRFTPNVAGYYKATILMQIASASVNSFCSIQKNGTFITFAPVGIPWAGIANTTSMTTVDVYMNGTTDYLEGFVYQASGGALNTGTGSSACYFSAFMFRSA